MKFQLNSDNTEVNFNFGGNLCKWQIQSLLQEFGKDYDSLKENLTAEGGWEDEDSKEQLIEFLESEDIKLMFPEFYAS